MMKAPEVSSRVNYRITLTGEATTAAKTLIKPCAVEMATCVLVDSPTRSLFLLSHLVITVKRSIQDLSVHLEKQ